ERHIELAAELGLPLIVHSRSADDDTVAVLRSLPSGVRGVMHCFGGGPALLEAALEADWYVSFAGVVTFKKFDAGELVRTVPPDRLLIETDSPYLTPVPHRGKRNEPAYVPYVAGGIAAIRGEPVEEVARRTFENEGGFDGWPLAGPGGGWPVGRAAAGPEQAGPSMCTLPGFPLSLFGPQSEAETSVSSIERMLRRIHNLDDTVATQIAAGEVVERPASVVKELIENSLDAAATRIEISVQNGGRTEIRVADDGCGMGREDALLALDRYATSKIATTEDLEGVRTFGFRGEALPSIASVSRLTLETAEAGDVGTRVRVAAGRVLSVEDCARQPGTTVVVRNLFFNVPARAKFLRTAAVETRAVADVVTSLALANLSAAFRLESNGRTLLDLPPAPDLVSRVAAIWGDEFASRLIAVNHDGGG